MSLRSEFLSAVPAVSDAEITLNGKTFRIGVRVLSMHDYDEALKSFQSADESGRARIMAGWLTDPADGSPLFTPEDVAALPLTVLRRLLALFTEVNLGTAETKKN